MQLKHTGLRNVSRDAGSPVCPAANSSYP